MVQGKVMGEAVVPDTDLTRVSVSVSAPAKEG